MKYKTIYADPPWPEYGGGRIIRGANRHYPLMTIDEIMQLKVFVQELSEENCHLYLWVTNNYLEEGLHVLKEWGFTYKTIITWLKDRPGLGQYFRGITEHCLFGVKGNLPLKEQDGIRRIGVTGFFSPKTSHSQKPLEMYKLIEKVSYPPFVELFARAKETGAFISNTRKDWDYWGNEK